jgi:hypothetical protein
MSVSLTKGCATTQDITETVLSASQLPYCTTEHARAPSVVDIMVIPVPIFRWINVKRSFRTCRSATSSMFKWLSYLVDGIRIACLGRATRNKGVLGLEAEGSKACWTSYLTELCLQASGSRAIYWETDKLIVLQIFRGPVHQAGYWASLIINRTNSFRDLKFQHAMLSNNFTLIFAGTPVHFYTDDASFLSFFFTTLDALLIFKKMPYCTTTRRSRQSSSASLWS